MSREGQIVHHFTRPFDEDEHECLPSKPSHEQAPVFINGKFTTVDIKLEWLVRTLCAHGFTTRYSCQGFKSLKKAHKAGSGDDRGYIMFEGESVYELLQRISADVEALYNLDQSNVWADLSYALVTRDGHMIAPAQNGSRWAVEFVREQTPVSPREASFSRGYLRETRAAKYNTVIRFPRKDLEIFRQIVELMFRNGIEL
jgi:hypothetical protein